MSELDLPIKSDAWEHGILVGIGGTFASGKDTTGIILSNLYNLRFMSVTDALREEAKRRGWTINRGNLAKISAEWRRAHGRAVLVDKTIADFMTVAKYYRGLVIASLRNPGESARIHSLGGLVVWIDAEPRRRYQRIVDNNRQRGDEDGVSFEEFMAQEAKEMNHTGDEHTLSMSEVRDQADITILNNFDNIEDFELEIKKVIGRKLQ